MSMTLQERAVQARENERQERRRVFVRALSQLLDIPVDAEAVRLDVKHSNSQHSCEIKIDGVRFFAVEGEPADRIYMGWPCACDGCFWTRRVNSLLDVAQWLEKPAECDQRYCKPKEPSTHPVPSSGGALEEQIICKRLWWHFWAWFRRRA